MVTGARVGGDESKTRFVADLTAPVGYSVYVLPNPYRVVIDAPDLAFSLPPGIGQKVRGLVSEYRYGVVEPGKSRIVIDTKGPVLIDKSFLVNPKAGQPARIVVDMVQTTEAAFMATYQQAAIADKGEAADPASEPIAPPAPDTVEEPQSQINHPVPGSTGLGEAPPPQPQAAAPDQTSPAATPAEPSKTPGRKLVVIDPGHGGIDPGASSPSGTHEKDVVLDFANALKKALQDTDRYDVVLTRDTDEFLSLKRRVEVAREHQADLFIAIHADTVRGQDARGATIYTLSDKASDAEAEELAKKENRADIIGGVDLEVENKEITNILIDLAQRESKNHAVLLSKKVVSQLKPLTLMTGKPMRSAGFVVLKAPDVPSVLLELGYLSSRQDEKLMTSPEWQARIAKAFAKAVDGYFTTELAARAD